MVSSQLLISCAPCGNRTRNLSVLSGTPLPDWAKGATLLLFKQQNYENHQKNRNGQRGTENNWTKNPEPRPVDYMGQLEGNENDGKETDESNTA